MKYLLLVIALVFIKPACAQDDLSKKEIANIQNFIQLLKSGNKEKLADIAQYPLLVKDGKVKVTNKADFIKKYNLIFDKELKDYILKFDVSEWGRVGSKGVMFRMGEVWFNEGASKLISVNGMIQFIEE